MKSFSLGFGIAVAAFTLSAAPAWAQRPESGGGGPAAAGAVDRASGNAGTPSSGGGAVDRGSGGASSAGSSGSSGSTSSVGGGGGGADFSSPSSRIASSPSAGFGGGARMRESAPEHRPGFGARAMMYSEDGQRATPRGAGPSSGGSSGTAVTRGGDSSSGGSSSGAGARAGSGDSGAARPAGRARTAAAAPESNNASGAREVPSWSRPRGDRPATGSAKDRTVAPPDRDGDFRGRYAYGYPGYYDPFYYGPGYGYGYNNYYLPYGFGMGYGLYSGLGWSPYYGDPFGDPYGAYGGYGGGYTSSYGRGEQGNLKLKVKPRSAKVYVDGYFVGYVDQFDGAFQKLALNTGRHKVEVRADGFETAEFDVLINPAQTVTFQGDLKRIQ
jgi:hypothetical protein